MSLLIRINFTFFIFFFFIVLSGEAIAGSRSYSPPPPIVSTSIGNLVGSWERNGSVATFKGIPYAIPPLREHRFERSELWNGSLPVKGDYEQEMMFDATKFGSPCLQNPLADPSQHPDPEAPPPAEDCLFLNVFKPAGSAHNTPPPPLLPVMVWIHGGGFCIGASSSSWYHGTDIAANQGVVVVTINYRLGPLGFLVKDDSGNGGMNGILDAVTALRWVKTHIESFGGDKDQITIFGQSSGGSAVCSLSAMPLARGLFRRAIVQSGPCVGKWGPLPISQGLEIYDQLLANTATTNLQQLKMVNVSLVQWPSYLMNDLTIAPNFSGYFEDKSVLPAPLAELYGSGGSQQSSLNPKEMIFGATSKDGTAAFYGTIPLYGNNTEDAYQKTISLIWGGSYSKTALAKIARQYPTTKYYNSVQAALVQADADEKVICPTHRLAHLASNSNVTVRSYSFQHYTFNGCDWCVELEVCINSTQDAAVFQWATHGSDIAYVLNSRSGPNIIDQTRIDCPMTSAENELQSTVEGLWGSFAREGHGGIPKSSWPITSKTAASASTLALRVEGKEGGLEVIHGYKKDDCDFWAEIEEKHKL